MNTTILSENLKKYRTARNLTQEQVASVLGLNAQTISRWECGTTLPDVLILPEISELYGITVDDLYKKNSVAYANYAQRLASVYEETEKPEDFLRCLLEFQKLMKEGELTIADKWNYAFIHHLMLVKCKEIAQEWYDKILDEEASQDEFSFYRACSNRGRFYFDIGKGEEFLLKQKERLEKDMKNPREWDLLIEGYINSDKYEDAEQWFQKAIQRFPEDWRLYIRGGEINERKEDFAQAIDYYDKAGEIGTAFYDELYAKAFCYKKMGDYENACTMFEETIARLYKDGYDVEAKMLEEDAREVLLFRKKSK